MNIEKNFTLLLPIILLIAGVVVINRQEARNIKLTENQSYFTGFSLILISIVFFVIIFNNYRKK